MECITFGTLRKYISRIDRLSICMLETKEYSNYVFLKDVPDRYDDLYVYGIGMIESEFYQVQEQVFDTVVGGRTSEFIHSRFTFWT